MSTIVNPPLALGISEEFEVLIVYRAGPVSEQLGNVACPEWLTQNFLIHMIFTKTL